MNIHRIYAPFLRHFRTKRMQQFAQSFRLIDRTRILDVGGSAFNWSLIEAKPQIVLNNINMPRGNQHDSATAEWIIADGRCLPFADGAFDIVYSNSVIEHLSTWANQQAFAAECARVGQRYYVQTPYRWFPIEPHLLTPLIHWLPKRWQRPLIRRGTVWGWLTKPSQQQCDSFHAEVRLLNQRDMRRLFPQAALWREKVLGWTKSLIAVKQ